MGEGAVNGGPLSRMSRRGWLRRAGALAGAALAGNRLGGQAASASPPSPMVASADWAARHPDLNFINLAGNENPFGPSQRVVMAIMRSTPSSCRYPFREERVLTEMIAGREGVDPACVVLGNGCDEILSMAGAAFGGAGGEIVATEPTYLQLMHYAEHRGATIRWIPHDSAMRHDLVAMEQAIGEATRLVYVCNPDTPTGTLRTPAEIRGFCESVCPRVPVFLDEVYLDLLEDFDAQTQVELVRRGLPLIIGRSFSKMHALAGHRIGYAVTTPELAERLAAERMSSLNYLGVAAARESLLDTAFHRFSRTKIREGRERYCALLGELGLRYTPSVGNFVFHHTGIPIRDFQAQCRERGFLVGRPFPPYEDWCRMSIGNPDEMRAFAPVLRELVAARG
jgi:histidinol-phosphate aminotransferase